MLKIFLSSHGRFASGIRSSCEILLGAQQNLTVFDAYVDNDTVQEHLDDFYKTVSAEDQVLLCSDLYGGSVNQSMYPYLQKPNTRLVSGVNMTFMMNVDVSSWLFLRSEWRDSSSRPPAPIEEVKRHRKPMMLSSKGSVEQHPEGEE